MLGRLRLPSMASRLGVSLRRSRQRDVHMHRVSTAEVEEVGVWLAQRSRQAYHPGQTFVHRLLGFRAVVLEQWRVSVISYTQEHKMANGPRCVREAEVQRQAVVYRCWVDQRDVPELCGGGGQGNSLSKDSDPRSRQDGRVLEDPAWCYVRHTDVLPFQPTSEPIIEHPQLADRFTVLRYSRPGQQQGAQLVPRQQATEASVVGTSKSGAKATSDGDDDDDDDDDVAHRVPTTYPTTLFSSKCKAVTVTLFPSTELHGRHEQDDTDVVSRRFMTLVENTSSTPVQLVGVHAHLGSGAVGLATPFFIGGTRPDPAAGPIGQFIQPGTGLVFMLTTPSQPRTSDDTLCTHSLSRIASILHALHAAHVLHTSNRTKRQPWVPPAELQSKRVQLQFADVIECCHIAVAFLLREPWNALC